MQKTQTYTIAELVDILALSPSKIHRLLEEKQLAAVRIDGVLRVPVEFVRDGQPLQSLRGTLIVLSDAGLDSAESIAWLFAFHDALQARPIDLLRLGQKSKVRQEASLLA